MGHIKSTNPVRWAKAYPYAIPEDSYVLTASGWHAIEGPLDLRSRERRTAVIASGSNAAPERLAQKFSAGLDEPLFVTRATLHDFDAVYSAHITSYGAIPATLQHAPGTALDVFVTWLSQAQLTRMHETEALGVNYDFARLANVRLELECGETLDQAHAYISRRGCLNRNGAPVPLDKVRADKRTWAPMSQEQVLDYARSLVEPESALDPFIQAHIDDPSIRAARTEALASDAISFAWEHVEVVA